MSESDFSNKTKYRCFGFSCNEEFLTEETIIKALEHKSIKGCAYILHNSDVINQDDIDSEYNEYTEKDLNKPKANHWHIDIEVNPAQYISTIAKWFCVPDNIVRKRMGAGAFSDYLAYLTHITINSKGKKWEYDPSEVKGLKFPEKAWAIDLKDYNDFKDYYEEKLLSDMTSFERRILNGELKPNDIFEKAPDYYINHMQKIDAVYRKYCNSLPLPEHRWNYYIYGDAGKGKDVVSLLLAINYLQGKYPDVNFDDMTKEELDENGYIYWAGNGSSTLQDYLGHDVIIWSDIRSDTLINTFGNTGNCFRALDMHPSPSKVKILYGNVRLVNAINIFNGQETYEQFIENLSVRWYKYRNSPCSLLTKEDEGQARRRFPFFIEVTTSLISLETDLRYLLPKNKKINRGRVTIKNDLQIVAQTNSVAEQANKFLLANEIHDAKVEVLDVVEKQKLPKNLFAVVSPEEEKQLRKKDKEKNNQNSEKDPYEIIEREPPLPNPTGLENMEGGD